MSEFFDPYNADKPLMLKCSCGRDHTVAEHAAEEAVNKASQDAAKAFVQTLPRNVRIGVARLIVEELGTNAMAYQRVVSDVTLDVLATLDEDGLALDVRDDGQAFDPTVAPVPDLDEAMERRAIGGWGLHLVRSLSDHIEYCRRDGSNHVHLLLLPPAAVAAAQAAADAAADAAGGSTAAWLAAVIDHACEAPSADEMASAMVLTASLSTTNSCQNILRDLFTADIARITDSAENPRVAMLAYLALQGVMSMEYLGFHSFDQDLRARVMQDIRTLASADTLPPAPDPLQD